MNKRFPAL